MEHDEVLALLRERVKQAGRRKQAALAREMGITPQHLTDVLKGRKHVGAQLADGMGLERKVVFVPRK